MDVLAPSGTPWYNSGRSAHSQTTAVTLTCIRYAKMVVGQGGCIYRDVVRFEVVDNIGNSVDAFLKREHQLVVNC